MRGSVEFCGRAKITGLNVARLNECFITRIRGVGLRNMDKVVERRKINPLSWDLVRNDIQLRTGNDSKD